MSLPEDVTKRLDRTESTESGSGKVDLFASVDTTAARVGLDFESRINDWLSGFAAAEARWEFGDNQPTGQAIIGWRARW